MDGLLVRSAAAVWSADVFRQAQRVFQSREPRLVTYDSTAEDDIVWGFGLGCNGVVDILIEFLADDDQNQIGFLTNCINTRKDGVLGKVFTVEGEIDSKPGDYLTLGSDLSMQSTIADRDLNDELLGDALKMMESKTSQIKIYETSRGRAAVFVEMIQPPLSIVVFGAGHDAIPVVKLAQRDGMVCHRCGWTSGITRQKPGFQPLTS